MKPESRVQPSGEWECMECGSIVAGARAQRPAECPDCGAPAQALEFFAYGAEEDDAAWDAESPEGLYDEADDVLDHDDDERPDTAFRR